MGWAKVKTCLFLQDPMEKNKDKRRHSGSCRAGEFTPAHLGFSGRPGVGLVDAREDLEARMSHPTESP